MFTMLPRPSSRTPCRPWYVKGSCFIIALLTARLQSMVPLTLTSMIFTKLSTLTSGVKSPDKFPS